jgi:hypothetical protein
MGMKKFVGVVFIALVLVIGQLYAQESATFYHIEVYSRTQNYFGDIPHFDINEGRLNKKEAYYEFYHEDTGYAFFLYATNGDGSAVTPPPRSSGTGAEVSKIFDWSGTSYSMFDTQVNKIVTPYLMTKKSEVEKLRVVLKYKLSVPR